MRPQKRSSVRGNDSGFSQGEVSGSLETSDRDCTLEANDRDCTLEVDRRVEDTNKETVNHNQAEAEADESGGDPGLSTVQRKRRPHRKWFICGGVSIVVLLIIIIVPSVIASVRKGPL
ncbi:hypothetical protein N7471_002125 [Penicillium samsonianum]|uniref:uncharacterized protein n=1 Tax=Penicillium samsonianum TaxID=1882272 RepID=UPI0025466957|nr:uncharacterized protein N7471_002125 [Penicillium samsonianum]KAJ6142672.1 hypothetical protein N7471_002125 [Penicillium samsonianum]